MDTVRPLPAKPTAIDWIFRVLGFVMLSATAFSLPNFPATDLDTSWRMALGKFFLEGRQFGTDVVFTYGPLGFAMGKTYWGGQWASLIAWQTVQAVVFAAIVYWHGYRLTGYSRLFFFIFFFLFGLTYEDAMHQTIIAFAGFELIRRSNDAWRWSSVALLALLAVLSLVKFTNMLLSLILVLLAGGLELWHRRRIPALRVPGIYLGFFLLGWMCCGQHLGNLPAYLRSSWEISQGYQDAMGSSCPPVQLYLGVTVLLLVVTCVLLNFATHPDRVRSAALTFGAGAYIYLNWKHGFIRADGHQVGFYYAALSLIFTAPLLLEEAPRFRRTKHLIQTVAVLLSLLSLEIVLPGLVRGVLGATQHEIDENLSFAAGISRTRGLYASKLQIEKDALDMLKTKTVVGHSTIDVLGFEQSVAIFNGFNYQPRPVFQGYSAYTPYLARLNYDYYASDRAPEYVLFKLQTIDYRLATMDDPHVLRLLVQRYTYLFTEQGFTLWKRKPGPFHAADFEPKPLRSTTVKLGQKIDIADLSDRNLWVQIDYDFSLLGKLRRFFFKPPVVSLRITDQKGYESVHRLPRPIGQSGFMLNPVVEDLLDFMRASGGTPKRRAVAINLETSPQDADCLQDDIRFSFSAVPPSTAGVSYFKEADHALFSMFVDAPISYEALNPPSEETIDKRRVIVMHAPSEMVFEVPSGAGELNGAFGFIPGAYSNGGRTNGAEFIITWSSGSGEPVILFERFMDPLNRLNDRGLQKFNVKLPKSTGRVTLRVNPGPYGQFAFDWTAWTGIEFK